MLEYIKQDLQGIMNCVYGRLHGRAQFYRDMWFKNYESFSHRGQKLLVGWVEQKSKELEDKAEQFFWMLNRPFGLLHNALEKFDDKLNKAKTTKKKEIQEKKYEDLEISRLMDEGGPPVSVEEDAPKSA